jgi:hypothetical protein
LVGIANDETDGGACRFSFEDATEPLDLVFFFSACGQLRLAWLATIQIGLNGIVVNDEPSRATVDYTTNCGAMGFPKSGQIE